MPVVFRHHGFRFLFYANEGSPREPAHIHAEKDGIVIRNRRLEIARSWNEFFGEAG